MKTTPTELEGCPSLRLEAYLPYRLALLSSRLRHSIEIVCERECGISANSWRVLALVAEFPDGCTASMLVDRRVMDAVAVHRAVRRLTAAELVSINTPETDRRLRLLVLTRPGREAYETLVPYALDLENRLRDMLGQAECERFSRALDVLLAQPRGTHFS